MRARTQITGLAVVAILATSPGAWAQDMPPGHPPMGAPTPAPPLPPGHSDVVPAGHPPTGAVPAGHPPTPTSATPGHATGGGTADADRAQISRVLQPPQPASARPSESLAAGTVRVLVVDGSGAPVPDVPVNIGSLAAGERSRNNGRTGGDGIATFTELSVGTSQAYRVNVPNDGATYSTAPFQLPTDRGYEVRVSRLPVTRDDDAVFFHTFRIMITQRGERMQVTHQTELTNAGASTFVFPEDGLRASLPEDALNFQFQRVMTNQRVEEIADEHAYAIHGSLPPGTMQLAWAYDLPVEGGDIELTVPVPLRFFGIQVVVEALPELRLDVRDLPAPERFDTQGHPCEDSRQTSGCAWVTQMRRGPTDAAIPELAIRISGIPGPGPVRWIAVFFTILLVFAGLLILTTSGSAREEGIEVRALREAALREEAASLAEELEAGDIGPEYEKRRRAEIARELAVLLYAGDTAEADGTARADAHAPPHGVRGFLAPRDGLSPAARNLELVTSALAWPMLVLGIPALIVRPGLFRAFRGQGEVALSLLVGLIGSLAIVTVAHGLDAPEPVTWTILGVCGGALALRAILRVAMVQERA